MKVNKEELVKYIDEHPEATQMEIATYFNVARQTIIAYIQRYDINFKRKNGLYSKININDLMRYIKENPEKTQMEVAEHFKVNHATISKCLLKNKVYISFPQKRRTKLTEEDLRNYIINNPKATQVEIAHDLGVSNGTISYSLKKYKIEWNDKRFHAKKKKPEKDFFDKIMEMASFDPRITAEQVEIMFKKKQRKNVPVRTMLINKKGELLRSGDIKKAQLIDEFLGRTPQKEMEER